MSIIVLIFSINSEASGRLDTYDLGMPSQDQIYWLQKIRKIPTRIENISRSFFFNVSSTAAARCLSSCCILAFTTQSTHTREHLLCFFFSVFDYFSCGSECKFSICSSVYVDVQHPTDYLNSIFEPSHSLGPLSLSRSLPVRNKLIYFSCFYFGITFTSLHTRG